MEEPRVKQCRAAAMLFDLDGTLGDTLPLIYRAFNDALEPVLKRTLGEAEIRSLFGPPDTWIIRDLVGPAEADSANAAYLASYDRNHDDLVPPFAGIQELLGDCAASGARIAVVTGKSRQTAILTLERLHLMPYVEVLYGGDDVERQKPDPLALQLVLAEFGIAAEAAVMIGDSAADILAGKAIGCQTIGVLWGSPDHSELLAAAPDIVVSSVSELRSVLLPT